jgi:hypothetical protein
MEPTPSSEKPARRPNVPIEGNPDRMNAPEAQTDQDVDTAGTEADESAVGSAIDQNTGRDGSGRHEPDRP